MKDYHGTMETRNEDGTLRSVMYAAIRRTTRKPTDRKRIIGNVMCIVRYFSSYNDFNRYYNNLKSELYSQKVKV